MRDLPILTLQHKTQMPVAGSWEDNISSTQGKVDHSKNNSALALGKESGIIALDFDYDVDGLHKEIEKLAGVSPVKKKGSKGFTAFYRYSGEKKKQYSKNEEVVIDLLGERSYTVLPPSIHPKTGKAYVWTTEKTLDNIEINTLPFLPTDFTEQVEGLIDPSKKKVKLKHKNIDEDIKVALTYIEPNFYETWVNVGIALKNTYGEKSFDLWDEWSSEGDTYNPEELPRKWSSFDSDGPLTVATIYKMAMDNGYRPDDFLLNPYKVKKAIQTYREGGYPIGHKVDIPEFNDEDGGLTFHLRNEATIVTGNPNCGKSELLDYICFQSAKKGLKTLYCSFEKEPEEHCLEMYHRYIGKPLEEWKTEEIEEAEEFINEHFYYYNHPYNTNKIEDIYEGIKNLTSKIKYDIIVIDPFGYLESDKGSSEQELAHVKNCCILLPKYAKVLQSHIFLVAHPKSYDKTPKWDKAKGKYCNPRIFAYHISGGASFYNFMDNMIILHKEADLDTQVEIKFEKIRKQRDDRTGSCVLDYDRRTRRFNTPKLDF